MVRLGKHTLDSGLNVSHEQHGLLRVGAISVGKVTEGLVQHPLESSMEALKDTDAFLNSWLCFSE